MSAAFNMIDSNHDGVITRAEFAGMGQPQPQPQPQYAQQAMGMTYAAPQMAMQAPVQYAQPQVQYGAPQIQYGAPQMAYTQPGVSAFDMIDRNHDGVITQAEFAGAAQPMYAQAQTTTTYAAPQQVTYAAPQQASYQPPMVYAAPQMETYATQTVQYAAPQQVSYQPPPQQMSTFDMVDRNHDGVITRAELQAARVPIGPPTVVSVNNLPLQRLPEAPQQQVRGAPVRTGIITGTRQLPFECPPLPEPVIPQYQQQAPQIQYGAPAAVYATPQQIPQPQQVSYAPPVQQQVSYSPPIQQQVSYQPPMQQQVSYSPPMQTISAPPMVQYAQPATAFDMMDRNHDGVISRAEFAGSAGSYAPPATAYAAPAQQAVTYAAPQTVMQPQYAAPQTMVQQAPVTYAAPATYAQPATMYGNAPSAFDMIDRNHDGVITQAEFAGMR